MDGVLADFVTGWYNLNPEFENPYISDPNAKGTWDMAKLHGISEDRFWANLDSKFFEGLSPMPEAQPIVDFVVSEFGINNVCILSSPPRSNPDAMTGKLHWISAHFPKFKTRYLFGNKKEFCAGPNKVLIDDYDLNVNHFREADGHAVLVPRPWNTNHHKHDTCLESIISDVTNILYPTSS